MKRLFLALACATLALGSATVGKAQDSAISQKILQSRAQSIVTLRIVSKLDANEGGQSANREMRYEIQGVVVDKEGLIMVSNVFLDPYSLRQSDQGEEAGVKLTPVSIKAVFDGDEKEYNAFVAATDKKLSLDFIKVEDLAGKQIVPVSFQSGMTPTVGQNLISISRLSRGFDYAAFFQSGHICGEVSRPRKAWMISGGISGFGLPVYSQNDEVAGVISIVPSSIKEDATNPDTMGMALAMRMLSGGSGVLQPFLIPCPIVEGLISQAKIRAVEVAEKRKNNKAAANTDTKPKPPVEVKPDPGKKPEAPKKPALPPKKKP